MHFGFAHPVSIFLKSIAIFFQKDRRGENDPESLKTRDRCLPTVPREPWIADQVRNDKEWHGLRGPIETWLSRLDAASDFLLYLGVSVSADRFFGDDATAWQMIAQQSDADPHNPS
jgi:hypothetical protein